MKKIAILILASIGLLVVQSAYAVPPGGVPATHIATFDIGSGTATVNSGVYQCNTGEYNGKYVYTYRISNSNTGVGLSFFSAGVTDGATVIGLDSEPGDIGPGDWSAIGDNLPLVQSVDASFDTRIKNGQGSTLLWFVSDYSPTMGEGFLFGFLSLFDFRCRDILLRFRSVGFRLYFSHGFFLSGFPCYCKEREFRGFCREVQVFAIFF